MFCLSSSTCIVLGLIHPLFLDCLLIYVFPCLFISFYLFFLLFHPFVYFLFISLFFLVHPFSRLYVLFVYFFHCLFFSLVCLPFYIFFFYHIFLSMTKLHLSSLSLSRSVLWLSLLLAQPFLQPVIFCTTNQ